MKCSSCNADGLTGLYCSHCGAKLPVNEENTNLNFENKQNGVQGGLQDVLLQYDSKQKKEVGLTAKKVYTLFGAIAAIILFIIIINGSQNNSRSEEQNKGVQNISRSKEHRGVQLIREGKWEEASQALFQVSDGDLKVLYNYAHSHMSMDKNNYEMALHYVSTISSNYKGVLSDEVKNYKKQLESNKIKHGFDLINDKNYNKASTWFYGLSSNDPTLKPLYNYAQAVSHYYTGDYNMALSYAKGIDGYSGYGSDVVSAFKEKVISEVTPEKIKEQEIKEKAVKKSQGVRIGMTKQEVLDSSWGKPTKINKTTGSYGVHEQWVYGGGNYLYFENGVLTTIQN